MFASVSSFAVRLAGMEALVKDSQGHRLLEIADSIPPTVDSLPHPSDIHLFWHCPFPWTRVS